MVEDYLFSRPFHGLASLHGPPSTEVLGYFKSSAFAHCKKMSFCAKHLYTRVFAVKRQIPRFTTDSNNVDMKVGQE